MAEEEPHVRKSKTLFIRNLPYNATNQKLEGIFGEIGPLKTCFVVKEKDSEKCKGYGYVAFSLLEDAEKAKDSVKSFDGRKIFISYADRKKDRKKIQHKQRKRTDEETENDEPKEIETKKGDDTSKTEKSSFQEKKYLQAKTILVKGWAKTHTLDEVKSILEKLNVKNISKTEYPANAKENTAIIRFKSIRDANRGLRKLNNKDIEGVSLSAESTRPKKENPSNYGKPQKLLKQSRLVVRNLSFKCSEQNLHDAFSKFGEITEVKIPLKPDGKMLGFGFVQFLNLSSANKAIKSMNMKAVQGRPVAVDWCVDKSTYLKAKGNDVDEDTEEMETKNKVKTKRKKQSKTSEVDSKKDESSDSDSNQDENDDHDDDESDDANADGDSVKLENSASEDDEASEDDNESLSEGLGNDEGDDDLDSNINKAKYKTKKSNDVNDGKTLFIRNVGFNTDEEKLENSFSKFGAMNYLKIVYDHKSGMPKGCAFVKFKKLEDTEKCLQECDQNTGKGITVDGRQLLVTLAVSRDKAKEYTEKSKTKKEKEDKRNLHLARVGLIRPGTQDAIGLTKDDLDKRAKVEQIKRQKLKNPNIFVSANRICVRNIPVEVDDKQLRKAYLQSIGDKRAKITECRVMRDVKRVNSSGVAKSRGYAFISFTDHNHAMKAIETTNNVDVFDKKRRLIVEFSLENKAALVAKEKRLERQKARVESMKDTTKTADTDKKQSHSKKGKGKQSNLVDKVIGSARLPEGQKKSKTVMPTHSGPKIRHKPRQSQIEKKKKKKNIPHKEPQATKLYSDKILTGKRKRKGEVVDDFDKLVQKHKQKLLSAKTHSKWFDG